MYNGQEFLFSLDIGTRSVIGTVLKLNGKHLEVVGEKYIEHEERAMMDGEIHDINLVSQVVKTVKDELEKDLHIILEDASIAAAGRYLNTIEIRTKERIEPFEEILTEQIRSLELKGVALAEEEIHRKISGELYCVGYSVKNYYLNSYLISNLEGHKGDEMEVELIATFLPRSVIDSLYKVMNNVGLKVANITLEPIAAIEAVVPQKLRLLNIALVDIGAGTSDIAISANESICAYGMVEVAGDEVTEEIAKAYLVDFNEAERMKREIDINDTISYTDVLGFENVVYSEEIKKIIKPIVKAIGRKIKDKIKELNGGKSPSAVFVVGGGAHTPYILEEISKGLNLPPQRIGIKDERAVEMCKSKNTYGSAGVTVLGIAKVALRNLGDNFIDVTLNDCPISLFNSHVHRVSDVLIRGGVEINNLIGKRGKSLRVTINGKKRLFFGEVGENAIININDSLVTLESEIRKGDKITIDYAKNGNDAKVSLKDIVSEVNIMKVEIEGEFFEIKPTFSVNGEIKEYDYYLKNGDDINEIFPNKVSDFKKYILMDDNISIYKNGVLLSGDEYLQDGEKLTKEVNKEELEKLIEEYRKEIKVKFNGEDVVLGKQDNYMVIDIFNYIDYDVKNIKGDMKLYLNGNIAIFTDELKYGDEIELR